MELLSAYIEQIVNISPSPGRDLIIKDGQLKFVSGQYALILDAVVADLETSREITPLYAMGSIEPRSFSRGSRRITGHVYIHKINYMQVDMITSHFANEIFTIESRNRSFVGCEIIQDYMIGSSENPLEIKLTIKIDTIHFWEE